MCVMKFGHRVTNQSFSVKKFVGENRDRSQGGHGGWVGAANVDAELDIIETDVNVKAETLDTERGLGCKLFSFNDELSFLRPSW